MGNSGDCRHGCTSEEMRKIFFVAAIRDDIEAVFRKYDGHIDDSIIIKALEELLFLHDAARDIVVIPHTSSNTARQATGSEQPSAKISACVNDLKVYIEYAGEDSELLSIYERLQKLLPC